MKMGDDTNDISGNGTVGVNVGPWRLRADWQSDYQHTRSNDDGDTDDSGTQKNWEWSRYYARRALPSLKAKLSLGEDYLNSDILMASVTLAAASVPMIKCYRQTCAATHPIFPALHTLPLK